MIKDKDYYPKNQFFMFLAPSEMYKDGQKSVVPKIHVSIWQKSNNLRCSEMKQTRRY